MKKVLLALCLLLAATTGWAEARHPSWQAPDPTEFPNSTPLYVKVNVLGSWASAPTVQQVAAFINGECRAEATSTNNLGFFRLRVWGDLETENGAPIEFRVMFGSLEYSFTYTEVFDGETETHSVPIELTLNPVVGIELTKPITVEAVLPATYDLADDIKIVYAEEQATPTSTLETPLKYTWDYANSEAFIVVDENNVLTAKQETGDGGVYLGLNIEGELKPDSSVVFTASDYTNVIVKAATIPVESISINPTEVTAYVGDALNPIIKDLNVVVGPENASNKAWNWEIVPEEVEWMYATHDAIKEPGTHQVKIYSISNPEVYTMLTINVKTPVSLTWDASELTCSPITPAEFKLTVAGDDFDPSKVELVCDSEVFNSDSPMYFVNPSGDGLTWEIHGKYVGYYGFEIYYDGELVMHPNQQNYVYVLVSPEIPYAAGWNWISVYVLGSETNYLIANDGAYVRWVQNDVIEIRSQEALLYNDPTVGVFGEIEELNSTEGMYKMKNKNAGSLLFEGKKVEVNEYPSPFSVVRGYNWFTYPYEYDLTLEEMPNIGTANEGDMIIGKDGFATYDGAAWVHVNGFKFEAGKGYIYFCANDNGGRVDLSFGGIPSCYASGNNAQPGGNVKGQNGVAEVWHFDATRFADNMPVIARVEGLLNPEQYTIGAFVGDECRGKGSLAKDDLMFINVAGKSGEKVTFRLYNTFTGEFFEVNEAVTYSAKAGTLRAPIRLSSPVVTGISNVKSAQDGDAIYNLAGQRLDKMQKGINILGGRKVLR